MQVDALWEQLKQPPASAASTSPAGIRPSDPQRKAAPGTGVNLAALNRPIVKRGKQEDKNRVGTAFIK